MKITLHGDTLNVSDIDELAPSTVHAFRCEFAALPQGVRQIDLDLSRTGFVDCGGLGALVAFWKALGGRNGGIHIRILNAPRVVQHLWKLLRLDAVLPIVVGTQSPAPALANVRVA